MAGIWCEELYQSHRSVKQMAMPYDRRPRRISAFDFRTSWRICPRRTLNSIWGWFIAPWFFLSSWIDIYQSKKNHLVVNRLMQFVRSDWVVVSISLWFLIACLISCFVIYMQAIIMIAWLRWGRFSLIFLQHFNTENRLAIFYHPTDIGKWAIAQILILLTAPPPPPSPFSVADLLLFSTPWRLNKIFTPEDFHEIWVPLGKVLWKLEPHPLRIPYYFTLP